MKQGRIDGLTDSRAYGKVCDKHPELNGLRLSGMRKYVDADGDVRHYRVTWGCVGCRRDRDSDKGVTPSLGKDDKYGDTWLELHGAMMIIQWMRGCRRITQ